MADILLFPLKQALTAAHQHDAQQLEVEASVADPSIDAWIGDDAIAGSDLEAVASLAAAPSHSIAALAAKMEVLVARLAPDDGTDTGLCIAETSLLRSVSRDLRALVSDAVFAAQGAALWAPVPTGAKLMQGTGAG